MSKACRQVCDIEFRTLSDMAPYLFFEDGNVTGLDFSADTTFAKKKGTNAIGFDNPIDGTIKIECQVVPTKLYALLSDGTIGTTAKTGTKKTIKATTAGTLTLPEGIVAGTVFVYAEGDYAGTAIEGTVAGTTFTATTVGEISADASYEIGYIATETTGVKVISFNNKKNCKDYYVTMLTNEKDEDGNITAKKIICYKVLPKKALSLSYSSEGEPVSVSIECSLLEDKDGNQIDMVEYDGE